MRKQRSRWTRGTMETLCLHRKMLFNPKYKILGLLSYPYWLIYECLAPIIEFAGIRISLVLIFFDILNWKFFFLFLFMVYTFAVMFWANAIFAEESTFKKYNTYRDLRKLAFIALPEPFIFHPFTVYAALRGNGEKPRGSKGWGDMTRTGFNRLK